MLNSRVPLTDKLVCHIQDIRTGNVIGAAKLTEMIGKPPGYISALENRRIKSISAPLLMKIFRVLHDNLSDEQIVEKIESIINVPKAEDASVGDSMTKDRVGIEGVDYLPDEYYASPHLIENNLEVIASAIREYHKQHPKDAVINSTTLSISLKHDAKLMMQLLKYPYFLLGTLTTDERLDFINDISQVFCKYWAIAKDKKDNSEETPV